MLVKTFFEKLKPNDCGLLEREANEWLKANPEIHIWSMAVSESKKDGKASLVLFIAYDYKPPDSELDEGMLKRLFASQLK